LKNSGLARVHAKTSEQFRDKLLVVLFFYAFEGLSAQKLNET
jgi:hypothetical protein